MPLEFLITLLFANFSTVFMGIVSNTCFLLYYSYCISIVIVIVIRIVTGVLFQSSPPHVVAVERASLQFQRPIQAKIPSYIFQTAS